MKYLMERKLKEGYVVNYLSDITTFNKFAIQRVYNDNLMVGILIGRSPLRSLPTKVSTDAAEFDIKADVDFEKHFLDDFMNPSRIQFGAGYYIINSWIWVKPDAVYCTRENNLFLFGWPNGSGKADFNVKTFKELALYQHWKDIILDLKAQEALHVDKENIF